MQGMEKVLSIQTGKINTMVDNSILWTLIAAIKWQLNDGKYKRGGMGRLIFH